MAAGLSGVMSDLRRELREELGQEPSPRPAPPLTHRSVVGGLAAFAVAAGVCALALAPSRFGPTRLSSARLARKGGEGEEQDDPLFQPLS